MVMKSQASKKGSLPRSKRTKEIDQLTTGLQVKGNSFFDTVDECDFLAREIIPEIFTTAGSGRTVRIWSVGCGTGQEAYSLAMLFQEELEASGSNIKFEIFASDIDPDVIAQAHDGFYSETIQSELTPARLVRFFDRVENGYHVKKDLRRLVEFRVQDILIDTPSSRFDFISCRHLLEYLDPEISEKVVSVFHASLYMNGMLLLGGSERIADTEKRFSLISEPHRLYRHAVQRHHGKAGLQVEDKLNFKPDEPLKRVVQTSPQSDCVFLCQQLILEKYASAVVLINQKNECLYSIGSTDHYLQMKLRNQKQDLLTMVRPNIRSKLQAAISQAIAENNLVVLDGDLSERGARFNIIVEPVKYSSNDLLLICFKDRFDSKLMTLRTIKSDETGCAIELEGEQKGKDVELKGAVPNVEFSDIEKFSTDQIIKPANKEILTFKKVSTTSKELMALVSQLQEDFEQQLVNYNVLQNVLISTDIATLFLDADFKIRLFTPSVRSLFNLIDSDIGRPIVDFKFTIPIDVLLADAQTVLQGGASVEREVTTEMGRWFHTHVSLCSIHGNVSAGIVITFVDITKRKHHTMELEAAKSRAELASTAKSRFLSAASHDLRQPLQTLALLLGIFAKTVKGSSTKKLIDRMEETLGATSGMLNAFLDINQIDVGTVKIEKTDFPLSEMLERLSREFEYHAQACGLAFHSVSTPLHVHSDQRLLEQMIRNLLGNAIKYTKTGKILIGCRRRGDLLSIQVWDTGVGIAEGEYKAIFEEYTQIGNETQDRKLGLGLGLSIVQQLGYLLGHALHVRSLPTKGSVFSINVQLAAEAPKLTRTIHGPNKGRGRKDSDGRIKKILIAEDDPDIFDLLNLLLSTEGYKTITAHDGVLDATIPVRGNDQPDLIMADFNLSEGVNGLGLIEKVRERFSENIPAIILTGDISTSTLSLIAKHDCVKLDKPVNSDELLQSIRKLLVGRSSAKKFRHKLVPLKPDLPFVFMVDDDINIQKAIQELFAEKDRNVEVFTTAEEYLESNRTRQQACLLINANLPGMSGLELLEVLKEKEAELPTIMITGKSDVKMAVQAMKAGVLDFIEKPLKSCVLLASVERALELSKVEMELFEAQTTTKRRIDRLTPRQRQIMDLVLAGNPSKNIAADLGISQRTVENHRAAIMAKTATKSIPELTRLAITAGRKLRNSGKKNTKMSLMHES
ncbi:CheR family methyltransferase [Sneathiella limimaris]|uniref:CheR family methyltransferase n=1 Tax=Sneathiella limimaris TaxID=1964213 RepID=UPI00146AE0EB|nr:CheR family methyltransferase [Sneathiella limimaris]